MSTKKFLSDIKKKLLIEKQDSINRSAQKFDIDTEGDETDEIQANIQIDLHHQMIKLNKHKIFMIDEALDRINKKTYGICIDCDEQISEKRLLANPYYLTCISCAEDREIEEKQRKGF